MSAIQDVRVGVSVMIDVMVPMRDGVDLSADIYLPPGDGPFPTLLCRTVYGKQSGEICTDLAYLQEWVPRFLGGGYAAVMQDCRGRYDSGGDYVPYIYEAPDGADTLAWLAAQPWCDGNIGMFGQSYVAFTQLQAALSGSPALKGILPVGNQEDNFGYFLMDGGVLQLQNFVWGINSGRRTMNCTSFEFLDVEALYRHMPLRSPACSLRAPRLTRPVTPASTPRSWPVRPMKSRAARWEACWPASAEPDIRRAAPRSNACLPGCATALGAARAPWAAASLDSGTTACTSAANCARSVSASPSRRAALRCGTGALP